ncbi:MAG TPA: NUDIX domain-containing protein [Ktedonobacteraceae bacterium]|nr:NUDIX domain-containing protein [Ktedonobacteraceae bacterium]
MSTTHSIKKCDHTSVGILVWKNDRLLLIERKRFPFGFAPPAGHVDGDASFEIAALRELKEEVNLDITHIDLLIEGKKDNHCRREGGDWHYWKIYTADAVGETRANSNEVKQIVMLDLEGISKLARKTEAYFSKEISEEEWQARPGLECVWYEWFKMLDLIKATP